MSLIHDPAALLAFALLAAVVGGTAAGLIHIPRVVGYLVAGLVLRQVLIRIFPPAETEVGALPTVAEAADVLKGIKTLALGLIMFALGQVFEVRHIRSVGRRVLRISVAELGLTFILVFIGTLIVWLLTSSRGPSEALTAALLLGIAALATAPAATVLVLQEYQARGTMSDTVLSLTALNNAACIVLFHVAVMILSSIGWLESSYADGRWPLLDVLFTSAGSVLLGGILGYLFSVLYSKLTLAEFVLVFLAILLSLGAFRDLLARELHMSFNFLLTALFVGATFANITPDQTSLQNTIAVLGKPIYATFFVLAGYDLHIEELGGIGLLGLTYVTFRVLGKYFGGYIGSRWVAAPGEIRDYIGLGLLCQAGVAIGLSDFLYSTWGEVGPDGVFQPHAAARQLKTVILGSVVIFELSGPFVLKGMAIRAGEVTAVSLLRRPTVARPHSTSSTVLAWQALTRTMTGRRPKPTKPAGEVTARHLMRSNVRLLPADARLDDVLHFAERSGEQVFPVVDPQLRLVGMIYYSDLRNILYDPVLRELVTADDLARPNAPTVALDTPLPALFEAFHQADLSALPVVAPTEDGGEKVVGIVEQRDLLKVLRTQEKNAR